MANVTEIETEEGPALRIELPAGDLAFPSVYTPRAFEPGSPLKHSVVMLHDPGDLLDQYCGLLGLKQGHDKHWAEGRLTVNASSMIRPEVDTLDPRDRRMLAELYATLPSRNLTGDALLKEYPCTVIVRPFDYERGGYQGQRNPRDEHYRPNRGTALGLRSILLDLSTVQL